MMCMLFVLCYSPPSYIHQDLGARYAFPYTTIFIQFLTSSLIVNKTEKMGF